MSSKGDHKYFQVEVILAYRSCTGSVAFNLQSLNATQNATQTLFLDSAQLLQAQNSNTPWL